MAGMQREMTAMRELQVDKSNGWDVAGKNGKAVKPGGKDAWKPGAKGGKAVGKGGKGLGKGGDKGKGTGKGGKAAGKSAGVGGAWGANRKENDKSWAKEDPKASADKECWPCNLANCKRPEEKWNYGDRVCCNWCGAAKNAAMNPPSGERRGGGAAPQEEEGEADDVNMAAGEATVEAGGLEVPPMLKADEVTMLKILGLATLKPRDKSKTVFPVGKPLVNKCTPDEEVAALCKTSDLLAAKQASVVFFQRQQMVCSHEISLLGENDATAKEGQEETLVFYKKKLADAEKQVLELAKKNSTGVAQVHELGVKKSQAQKKETDRVQQVAADQKELKEEFERLMKVFDAQVAIMAERRAELAEEFRLSAGDAEAQNKELAKRHLDKVAAWDTRINLEQSKAGGAPAAVIPPAQPTSVAEAEAQVVEAQKVAAKGQKALEEALRGAAALQSNLEALPPQAPSICSFRIRYAVDELVPLNRELEPDEVAAVEHIAAMAEMWTQYGLIPVTYRHLLRGVAGVEQELFTMVQGMIGPLI